MSRPSFSGPTLAQRASKQTSRSTSRRTPAGSAATKPTCVASHLARLSDADLLACMPRIARAERAAILDVVLHIAELDRRKLYLDVGFGTLFDYCTRHLKFSNSAAGRRITASRALRRFPVVAELLGDGRVNLCTLSLLSGLLTDGNHAALLAAAAGKSYREVVAMVARYRPRRAPRDRVRAICVAAADTTPRALTSRCEAAALSPRATLPIAPFTPSVGSGDRGCDATPNAERSSPASETTPSVGSGSAQDTTRDEACKASPPENDAATSHPPAQTTTKLLIQFAADPDLMAKVEEARALLSHKAGPNASLECVFDAALEAFLDAHCPRRRHDRREQRRRRRQEKTWRAETGATPASTPNVGSGIPQRRHVPADVRDEVFRRDGGRCTYTSPGGRRCGSPRMVEVDHIVPVARGGTNSAANLRLLCASHNKLEAERTMGTGVMRRYWRRE